MSPLPPAASEPDESRVCLSCGLCCSGTVYSVIPLEAGEEARAAASGFALVRDADGERGAAQPCPQLQGTACRLYGGWRPRACEDYACRLLGALRRGELSEDEAMARIARLKAMIAQHLPDSGGRSLRALVSEAAELTRRGAIDPDEARLVVAVGAVNLEIDRVIRHPGQSTFR